MFVIYDGRECRVEFYLDRRFEMRFKYLDIVFFEVILFCGFSISFSSISFEAGFFFLFKVDVRMIDFVYSTFKGFRDDFIVYDGSDRGYVFGLENFISIME